MPPRLTHATALVLRAIATGHVHGFRIMEITGLPSGTVYPVLRRLELHGCLASSWEDEVCATQEGRPRRRLYRLTRHGADLAVQAAERLGESGRLLALDPELRPAEGGGA